MASGTSEQNGIVIHNFSTNNEIVVQYPFPIIRGEVRTGHDIHAVVISRKLLENTDDSQMEWPVRKCSFCGVLQLELGENQFTISAQLSADLTTLVFRVIYSPAQNSKYFVMPLYILCADSTGSFQSEDDQDGSLESAVKRISTGAGLIQSFTAEQLQNEGFSRKTFQLYLNKKGLPHCEVFRTRLKTSELYAMEDRELWAFLKDELADTFPALKDRCKFLAFLSATRYYLPSSVQPPVFYEDMLKCVKGHIVLGGSTLAVCGTGCLYTWPESVEQLQQYLADERPVDYKNFMDDSAYRGTRWACFSTTLGAACHELGHTFDLGHTPQENSIMARGFDDIYKVFTVLRPQPVPVSLTIGLKMLKQPQQTRNQLDASAAVIETKDQACEADFPELVDSSQKMQTAVMDPEVKTKEKNFAAKVSGKLHKKLFSSKRDAQQEEYISSRNWSVDSHPHEDNLSIPSSCTISLCEADGNHSMHEACNVSVASTRPSSTISGASKSRTWQKKFSLRLLSPTESFNEETAVIKTKTDKSKTNETTTPLITKSYTTHTVHVPSTVTAKPEVHTAIETAPPPAAGFYSKSTHKPTDDKQMKLPWARLFSKKKKDHFSASEDRSPVSGEEKRSPDSGIVTVVEIETKPIPYSAKLEERLEEVASQAGSDFFNEKVDGNKCFERGHLPGVSSVDGVISESEDEIFELKTPDSLDKKSSFKTSSQEPVQISVSVSRDIIEEIKEQSMKEIPNLEESSSEQNEMKLTSRPGSSSEKPQPSARGKKRQLPLEKKRNGKNRQDLSNGPTTDASNPKISSQSVHDNFGESPRINPKETSQIMKPAKPVRNRSLIRSEDLNYGVFEDQKRVDSASNENVLKAEKVNTDENQIPERAPSSAKIETLLTKAASRNNIDNSEADLFSEKKEKSDIGNSASKLRYPLRTRDIRKDIEIHSETVKKSKLNNFTKSTIASSNKENKIRKINSEDGRQPLVRRKSIQRRNSEKKKRTTNLKGQLRNEAAVPAPPSKTLTGSSHRLDFKHISEQAHSYPYATHKRSASRDSIGNLGDFINTDCPEKDDMESVDEGLDSSASPVSETENRKQLTLPRKKNASSLVNTPSGISVMEDFDRPHRLPMPVRPPESLSINGHCGEGVRENGPTWTRPCAILLDSHKWFNPTGNENTQTPPKLKGDRLTSQVGLRMVEIRDLCGNALSHLQYAKEPPVKSVQIVWPKLKQHEDKCVILAVDIFGNMLHRTVSFSNTGQ